MPPKEPTLGGMQRLATVKNALTELFPVKKPIIGVIHLQPLPGAPRYAGQSLKEVYAKAVTDAKASIKDLDTLKAAFPVIGKSCGGCHETYRVKHS